MTEVIIQPLQRTDQRVVAIMLIAVAAIALPALYKTPTLLLWNATDSVPVGLYFVIPDGRLRVGDLAVTALPTPTRALAAQRNYLPADVPLIKPVAALPGYEICRQHSTVSINGRIVGHAQATDRLHRALPEWTGCRIIETREIFLMNPSVSDSFDGRYFGPISIDLVRGRAVPLLTFRAIRAPSSASPSQ